MTLADRYVLTGQAATMLNVNRLTVQRWVRAGLLRGERGGYVTLIDRAQVEQLANGEVMHMNYARGSMDILRGRSV